MSLRSVCTSAAVACSTGTSTDTTGNFDKLGLARSSDHGAPLTSTQAKAQTRHGGGQMLRWPLTPGANLKSGASSGGPVSARGAKLGPSSPAIRCAGAPPRPLTPALCEHRLRWQAGGAQGGGGRLALGLGTGTWARAGRPCPAIGPPQLAAGALAPSGLKALIAGVTRFTELVQVLALGPDCHHQLCRPRVRFPSPSPLKAAVCVL